MHLGSGLHARPRPRSERAQRPEASAEDQEADGGVGDQEAVAQGSEVMGRSSSRVRRFRRSSPAPSKANGRSQGTSHPRPGRLRNGRDPWGRSSPRVDCGVRRRFGGGKCAASTRRPLSVGTNRVFLRLTGDEPALAVAEKDAVRICGFPRVDLELRDGVYLICEQPNADHARKTCPTGLRRPFPPSERRGAPVEGWRRHAPRNRGRCR